MTVKNGREPALPTGDVSNAPMLGGKRRLTFKNIRPALLERAENKCEQCGVANGAVGARDLQGEWWDYDSIGGLNSDAGYFIFGGPMPLPLKIVLICTRLENEDISNEGLDNLAMLCQRCHFRERREPNMTKARETRARKRLELWHKQAQDVGQEVMDL